MSFGKGVTVRHRNRAGERPTGSSRVCCPEPVVFARSTTALRYISSSRDVTIGREKTRKWEWRDTTALLNFHEALRVSFATSLKNRLLGAASKQ